MRHAQARAPRAEEGYSRNPAPRRLRAVEPSSPSAAHSSRPVVSASRPDPARRTVLIGEAPPSPRRPRPARARRRRRPLATRPGAGPDRLALWAVILGLMMAVVAAASARAEDAPDGAAGEAAAPLAAPVDPGSD